MIPQLSCCVFCVQIAGDMLCADQNFDIAQVNRFFRSKVEFTHLIYIYYLLL